MMKTEEITTILHLQGIRKNINTNRLAQDLDLPHMITITSVVVRKRNGLRERPAFRRQWRKVNMEDIEDTIETIITSMSLPSFR